MNIVLSGPFGLGSLSDELVLAGVLKPLRSAKHTITVLTADKENTLKLHAGIEAVQLPSAASMVSTPGVWKMLEEAHFFAICGAGMLSDKGKVPARVWLAQLEQIKPHDIPTAVIGTGAVAIDDRKEEAKVQRFLHHFAGSISVRDEASKIALIDMGMSANRISVIGDPALSLYSEKLFDKADAAKDAPAAARKVAFFFADGVPMRQTFAPEPTIAPGLLGGALNGMLKALAAEQTGAVIFHDSNRQNEKLARHIADGVPHERVEMINANHSIKDICVAMSGCAVAVTDTLHGLLLAATHGVPAVYLYDSPAALALVKKMELDAYALSSTAGMFDAERALELIRQLMANRDAVRAELKTALATLAKKEAQNTRMVEKLVPKRMRYPKEKKKLRFEEDEEDVPRRSKVWNRV